MEYLETEEYRISAREGNSVRAANHRDLAKRDLGFKIPHIIQGGFKDSEIVMEKVYGRTWEEMMRDGVLSTTYSFNLATVVANQMESMHRRTGLWLLDREPSNVMIGKKSVESGDLDPNDIVHIDLRYVYDDSLRGVRSAVSGNRWRGEPFIDPEDEVAHNIAVGVCLAGNRSDRGNQAMQAFAVKWNNGDTSDPDHQRLHLSDLRADIVVLKDQLNLP